jgi:hypothetical protein
MIVWCIACVCESVPVSRIDSSELSLGKFAQINACCVMMLRGKKKGDGCRAPFSSLEVHAAWSL